MKVEINFTTDVASAPLNKIVIAWGNGGWRFMRRDAVGQWRSIMGRAKPAPKMWADCPSIALEDAP